MHWARVVATSSGVTAAERDAKKGDAEDPSVSGERVQAKSWPTQKALVDGRNPPLLWFMVGLGF